MSQKKLQNSSCSEGKQEKREKNERWRESVGAKLAAKKKKKNADYSDTQIITITYHM